MGLGCLSALCYRDLEAGVAQHKSIIFNGAWPKKETSVDAVFPYQAICQ